jgi:hypothetical protein
MSVNAEKLINDIAARVARRVAAPASDALPKSYVLVALSGDGRGLDEALDRLAREGGEVVVVADCPSGSAAALGSALARLPAAHAVSGEAAYDADALVARAARVLAPAMDLALASRVAALQADTPAARAILRAVLAGITVEATLDDRAFAVSSRAATGARDALSGVLARLESLGVAVALRAAPRAAAVAAAAGAPHPSQERFTFAEPLDEFVEYLESRPCSIEAGKPCVNCGVCEARGF